MPDKREARRTRLKTVWALLLINHQPYFDFFALEIIDRLQRRSLDQIEIKLIRMEFMHNCAKTLRRSDMNDDVLARTYGAVN